MKLRESAPGKWWFTKVAAPFCGCRAWFENMHHIMKVTVWPIKYEKFKNM
jgi:hypothetical protein